MASAAQIERPKMTGNSSDDTPPPASVDKRKASSDSDEQANKYT